MKIIGIGGSLRPESYTYQALSLAIDLVKSHKDVEGELVDLRKLHLPFCDGSVSYPDYPDLQKFRETVNKAQGIIIATPEYHGHLSGVLKNALDLLDEDHMKGKVVALLAIVGGLHSNNAINSLRLICRQLHCWVLPEQMIISNAEESFKDGKLIDPSINLRLQAMMEHFIHSVRRFS